MNTEDIREIIGITSLALIYILHIALALSLHRDGAFVRAVELLQIVFSFLWVPRWVWEGLNWVLAFRFLW